MTERTGQAHDIIRRYVKWSAAAGLVYLPVVDVALVTGVQLKMVGALARLYEVPFRHDRAKAIVGALVGAIAPQVVAGAVLGALAPVIGVPVLGPALVLVSRPTFDAAATYALGRVFVQHFEAGGTLLDMDPDALREHFRSEFQAAKA